MSKRTSKDVRKAILKVLNDNEYHSYGELERKVNTNWETIRNHCDDFEIFGAVTISEKGVKITRRGNEILKNL